MKLTFQNDVIGLSAETPEEEDICDLLALADGYVFQLHASSGRGMALSLIGPEDTARRAPLNIVHSIAPHFAPISNLAHTPFELAGQHYASIEGFWQGLKRVAPVERRAMATSKRKSKSVTGVLYRPPSANASRAIRVPGSPTSRSR